MGDLIKQSEWIPVKERYPDKQGVYLVTGGRLQ